MILIPEIETVIILVPRTGTKSLIEAVKERYPEAMRIYRHMEADGIPAGYDRWRRVGMVRDPLHRLWSLFKYLQDFDGPYEPEYIAAQRASVQRDFSDWILNNELPFTQPYDSSGNGKFYPKYNLRHNLPENRKSQFMYLRPDLGTEIYQYTRSDQFYKELDLQPRRINHSRIEWLPCITKDAMDYLCRQFAWDISVTKPQWVSDLYDKSHADAST
jgi:hypothetical protein